MSEQSDIRRKDGRKEKRKFSAEHPDFPSLDRAPQWLGGSPSPLRCGVAHLLPKEGWHFLGRPLSPSHAPGDGVQGRGGHWSPVRTMGINSGMLVDERSYKRFSFLLRRPEGGVECSRMSQPLCYHFAGSLTEIGAHQREVENTRWHHLNPCVRPSLSQTYLWPSCLEDQ